MLQLIRSVKEQFVIKVALSEITPEYFDSVDEIGELLLEIIGDGNDG